MVEELKYAQLLAFGEEEPGMDWEEDEDEDNMEDENTDEDEDEDEEDTIES